MAAVSGSLPVTVDITPRFEVFYALQALESGASERLSDWRREMERRLPARARTTIAAVAPSPLMWPLVADALRDEPPDISFERVISAITALDANAFQRCVLGGVFKSPGTLDGLMTGVSLKRTVLAEAVVQQKLLSLLGLHPFNRESAAVHAFERIVSQPLDYRDEVLTALEIFWQTGFQETWNTLSAQMHSSARSIRQMLETSGFAVLASERELPVTVDRGAIVTGRGKARIPIKSVTGIHLMPSAFNVSKLWATYTDSHKRSRMFIPVLDPGLSLGVAVPERDERRSRREAPVDPASVFKALGDTTRYAMATTLARTPMTSVELARIFKVSKPTISHHVQQLRAASLLIEQPTEAGVVLSLDRRALERASSVAATEMFSETGPEHVVRRSRKANRT